MKKVFTLIILVIANLILAEVLPVIKYENLKFGDEQTLEIVSWNIQNFPKSQQTLEYAKNIIAAIDADVFGFQEIESDSAFVELVKKLNEGQSQNKWKGYRADTDEWNMNLAYIYKENVIDDEKIYQIYPDNDKYHSPFPRKPLVLEFSFQNEILYVINNHYKARTGEKNLKRRREASRLIDEYIKINLNDENVVVIGDLNDTLTDQPQENAFNIFLDDKENYKFVDWEIAVTDSADWSYPYWKYRGHIDHLLISNELFDEFSHSESCYKTIVIDEFMEGKGDARYKYITDHRPVALKLKF